MTPPSSRASLEEIVAEMREAVVNADRPYPIAIFHETVTQWANTLDRLAVLSSHLQGQEEKEVTTRVDEPTVIPPERATAALNEPKDATAPLDHVTDRRLREHLCFSHGHTGQYGDDGELQCGSCAGFGQWDYRRAPIADLLNTIERVNMARFVAEASKAGRVIPSTAVSATTADQGSKDEEKK